MASATRFANAPTRPDETDRLEVGGHPDPNGPCLSFSTMVAINQSPFFMGAFAKR
jgi:hypothetical protein